MTHSLEARANDICSTCNDRRGRHGVLPHLRCTLYALFNAGHRDIVYEGDRFSSAHIFQSTGTYRRREGGDLYREDDFAEMLRKKQEVRPATRYKKFNQAALTLALQEK